MSINTLAFVLLAILITSSCNKLTTDQNQSLTQGVDHVGLSVSNLEVTSDFFIKALGFNKIKEDPDYPAIFVSDGKILVTLWQIQDPKLSPAFNRKKNIGLHHLAFAVKDFQALDHMFERLKNWEGVNFEFGPELLGKGPSKHMIFHEPGGIRLELIARQ